MRSERLERMLSSKVDSSVCQTRFIKDLRNNAKDFVLSVHKRLFDVSKNKSHLVLLEMISSRGVEKGEYRLKA